MISLNSVLLVLLVNFVSGFRLELICISLIVCIRSIHSSPWFSATCAAAIVQRNHLFRLHQQNKSSESIVGFRQASNHCKRLLEAAKLAYANNTKKSIISHKLGSRNFFYDQITACCDKSAGLSHDELRTLSSAQIAVVYRTSSGRQLK